jgi:hypothetical protein
MTPAQKDEWIAELRTSLAYAQLKKTLRDEFAMAALPVVFERYGAQQFDFQLQAARAYAVADAMMQERHK